MFDYLYDILYGYFSDGGMSVMLPIFVVSLVSWYIGVSKLSFLNRLTRMHKKFTKELQSCKRNEKNSYNEDYTILLEESLRVYNSSKKQSEFEMFFKEFLLRVFPQIDSNFTTMSVWVGTAPLLGLLGTVTGMIQTFQAITDYGLDNPNLTAGGISIALITTQAGLTAAFPLVIFHNYLRSRAEALKNRIIKNGEELMNLYKQD